MSFIPPELRFADIPLLDAFGRLRVSSPQTLFDSKCLYDADAATWNDVALSGAGTSSTYNTNQASVTIAVTANTGHRVRQTKKNETVVSVPLPSAQILGATVAGVMDELYLGVQRLQGTSESFYGSMSFREV